MGRTSRSRPMTPLKGGQKIGAPTSYSYVLEVSHAVQLSSRGCGQSVQRHSFGGVGFLFSSSRFLGAAHFGAHGRSGVAPHGAAAERVSKADGRTKTTRTKRTRAGRIGGGVQRPSPSVAGRPR